MEDERRKLDETEQSLKSIEDIGYKLQEQGSHLVKYARHGQVIIRHIRNDLEGYWQIGNDYPAFQTDLHNLSASIDYSWQESIQLSSELSRRVAEIDKLTLDVSSTGTTTASALLTTISGVEFIQEQTPETDIYEKYRIHKPPSVMHNEIQSELDKYLNEIDPQLVQRRQGCWITLRSISSDKMAQAAHTARDILAKLISKWAPNDEVKKAEWWEPVEDTKDGVSLRQRFRYLIYGPKDTVKDETELNIICTNVDKCFKDDQLLKKIAHGGTKRSIEAVESVIKEIEGIMLQIIKSRLRYHGSLKL